MRKRKQEMREKKRLQGRAARKPLGARPTPPEAWPATAPGRRKGHFSVEPTTTTPPSRGQNHHDTLLAQDLFGKPTMVIFKSLRVLVYKTGMQIMIGIS